MFQNLIFFETLIIFLEPTIKLITGIKTLYSSKSHNDNRKNNFLVLAKGPTKGINDSIGAVGKKLVLTLAKKRKDFA